MNIQNVDGSTNHYLLSLDVIEELIQMESDSFLLAWLENVSEDYLYLCSLTIGQLASLALDYEVQQQKLIMDWLVQELIQRFDQRLIDLDHSVFMFWGLVQSRMRQNKLHLSIMDSLLAACAVKNNFVVVTKAPERFLSIDCPAISPWQP